MSRSLGDILSDSWRGGREDSTDKKKPQEQKNGTINKKTRPQFVPPKSTHEDDCVFQQQEQQVKQSKSKPKHPNKDASRSKKTNQDYTKSNSRRCDHSRRFQDTNDWRNSSIDWGDDHGLLSDEDEDDYGIDKSWRPEPIGTRRGSHGSKVSQRRFTDLTESTDTAETQSSSLSHSLTSMLSIRKIDP